MHIRPIVQAPKHSHNPSMALAAGGLLAFAVLVSGVWHPKFSGGGVTQVGREASITFDDGTVLTLTEPESDLDILRRRRMRGWGGHEFRQIFVMADGTEMEVGNSGSRASEDGDELSGSHLMLTAYHQRGSKADAPLDQGDGVVVADLHVDGKDKVVASQTDAKDRVTTDVIDAKDVSKDVVYDPKDTLEQPVFALTTTGNPYQDGQGVLMALMGDPGSMWGDIRTASSTGLLNFGQGGSSTSGSGTTPGGPPIGTAVPEPSTWSLVGLAGVAALVTSIRRQRRKIVAA